MGSNEVTRGPMRSDKVICGQLRSYEIIDDHKLIAEITEGLLGFQEEGYGHLRLVC